MTEILCVIQSTVSHAKSSLAYVRRLLHAVARVLRSAFAEVTGSLPVEGRPF